MSSRASVPGIRPLDRASGCFCVRIPKMDTEAQRAFLEEVLLPGVDSHSEGTWVIDLSEYGDGITLALAGGLARFCEAAQLRECQVRYTGLVSGIADCRRAPGTRAPSAPERGPAWTPRNMRIPQSPESAAPNGHPSETYPFYERDGLPVPRDVRACAVHAHRAGKR